MRSIMDARRERLRQYVTDHGGPTSVAKALGYSNGSFLSQLIGPKPSRPFTEKVARSIEEKLGLAPNWLEGAPIVIAVGSKFVSEPRSLNYDRVISGVRAVAAAADARGVKPSPGQFATLIELAGKYIMPDGQVDEATLDRLMDLVHDGGG